MREESWKAWISVFDDHATVILIYYAQESEICDNECEIAIFTDGRDTRDDRRHSDGKVGAYTI